MKTIAVLRGGPSDEHEVSLKTGGNVLTELGGMAHYRAVDVYIDKAGLWHVRGVPMPPERALSTVDAAFNALHGAYGEDGQIQRLLDRLSVPYTGSGALGSALAMNKVLAKEALKKHGVTLARSVTIIPSDTLEDDLVTLWRIFPQPSIVKPASSGSSVGVTMVKSFQDLVDGVKKAFQHSSQVLVEEFIAGREATVGVVEGFRGKALYDLPVVEIVPPSSSTFFDYGAKYGGETLERVPGNFSRAETEALAAAAKIAHEGLGLRHYSRSDFIVSPKGHVYYLETNTLPGLTGESLLPKSLAAVGVGMPEFLDHLIGLAIER